MLGLTAWAVREALAFDGIPKDAASLAVQLDEPPADVRSALSELVFSEQIAYVGGGRYVAVGAGAA